MSVPRKAIKSLAFDNLTFSYETSTPIFENITFEMPKSRAVWLRSPGQRGKSTMLKILAGLLTPNSGRYLINGEAVSDMSFEEFLPYRLSMGYGFDFGGLFNNKSLSENLTLPLLYHNILPPDEAAERVNETLDLFGVSSVRDQRPFAVSGSQRKLFCVIRPFIHWPQVVFLDDPVTGLKQDNLNDLFHYVDEAFAGRGLKQMFFTGESPVLANRFQAEELLVSGNWLTTRSAA